MVRHYGGIGHIAQWPPDGRRSLLVINIGISRMLRKCALARRIAAWWQRSRGALLLVRPNASAQPSTCNAAQWPLQRSHSRDRNCNRAARGRMPSGTCWYILSRYCIACTGPCGNMTCQSRRWQAPDL